MTVAEEPVKKLHIRVVFNHQTVDFMIKPNKPLAKVFDTFATKLNLDIGSLRFHAEEQRLYAEMTPEQAGLSDGDQIDVVLFQEGGSFKLTL
ncbi:hypothetical protein CPB83DRAFT_621605 [Crepidotus variabilis]|uniref:Ubiquitin-like domain-containing protein n=1 Tax=Crepidotus variabilis TaxID=179855 RepID=A0A9P6JKS4_9AGAR|nr:hypothetical protein CPB83DRAFT_621605 [Crepidotus variabilis]